MRSRCCHHVLMFWVQRGYLGRKGYATVTGKGGERRMIPLGPWRWAMLGYSLSGLLTFGIPADVRAAAGGVRQSLGPRFRLDRT